MDDDLLMAPQMEPPSSQTFLASVLYPLPGTPKAVCSYGRIAYSWLGEAVYTAEGPVTLPALL